MFCLINYPRPAIWRSWDILGAAGGVCWAASGADQAESRWMLLLTLVLWSLTFLCLYCIGFRLKKLQAEAVYEI
jgi:predicted membrane protein